MHVKLYLALMAGVVALLLMGGSGFAAPPIEQPPKTSYMQSTGGNAGRVVPAGARGSQKGAQGR